MTNNFSALADLQTGRDGDTEILLTELVQAWVDVLLPNNGICIIPRSGGCTPRLLSKSVYPGSAYGTLVVRYVERGR